MASFRQKKITRSQNMADKLRQARLDQGKSLEEIARDTKIQVKYLEFLEEGDYQKLPGDIYSKAWIKLYAEYLSLDAKELLVDYKIEKTVSDRLVAGHKVKDNSKSFNFYNFLKPGVLKISVISILIVGLLSYIAWEINNTLSAPEIVIFEPGNNIRTTESSIVVRGQAEAEVQVSINNELTLLDKEGNFSKEINLVNGLNNLSISAKKKHSKSTEIELVIFRELLE